MPLRRRRFFANLATCCVLLGTLAITGCSAESRKKIADVLFEGKPSQPGHATSQPVVRKPRRLPAYAQKPQPGPTSIDERVLAKNAFFQRDWPGFMKRLPKDPTGRVDWVAALNNGQIQPAPGLKEGSVDQPVLPLDIVLEPEAQPVFKVVFPHRAHTQWLSCSNCHMKIFQMKKGADQISMADIFAGKDCGVCHGKVAFDVNTGCVRCHPVLAGPT